MTAKPPPASASTLCAPAHVPHQHAGATGAIQQAERSAPVHRSQDGLSAFLEYVDAALKERKCPSAHCAPQPRRSTRLARPVSNRVSGMRSMACASTCNPAGSLANAPSAASSAQKWAPAAIGKRLPPSTTYDIATSASERLPHLARDRCGASRHKRSTRTMQPAGNASDAPAAVDQPVSDVSKSIMSAEAFKGNQHVTVPNQPVPLVNADPVAISAANSGTRASSPANTGGMGTQSDPGAADALLAAAAPAAAHSSAATMSTSAVPTGRPAAGSVTAHADTPAAKACMPGAPAESPVATANATVVCAGVLDAASSVPAATSDTLIATAGSAEMRDGALCVEASLCDGRGNTLIAPPSDTSVCIVAPQSHCKHAQRFCWHPCSHRKCTGCHLHRTACHLTIRSSCICVNRQARCNFAGFACCRL